MAQKKDIKRAARAVWDRVKALRDERAKLYPADELEASARDLAQCADDLNQVARERSLMSAMPPSADPQKSKTRKGKSPPSTEG